MPLITVHGADQAQQDFDAISLRASNTGPVLSSPAARVALEQGERRIFASGEGWEPDTPDWVERKRRDGLSTQTLEATGQLRGVVTSGTGMDLSAHDGVLVWSLRESTVRYGRYVADKRPFVGIDSEASDELADLIGYYVVTGGA